MRILSSRVLRARRDRSAGQVVALIALTAVREGIPVQAHIQVAAPARAPGAAALRARLLGAAKLSFAAHPERHALRRAA
ncbi:hypothetical protein DEA8626_02937 [Defluviimonas aquaemixtae]|uniref:Uncharacterized protein n=1 Tax=Albidovulum aquaemixtae TaxID=1542388 RepID=A0A2R8BKG5_9RHOB|nr:hypothetical protein DEA8626_02937 [Defluviimonas aquaemixtae]